MSRTLVVSQPMFLPWIGLFEQVRLADVFVHYDDVRMPQGRSFVSRVQIRNGQGTFWLTLPIDRAKSGSLISDVRLLSNDWRSKHLKTIRHAYRKAPYFSVMFELVERIYSDATEHLALFNMRAIDLIANWLGFAPRTIRSSESGVAGSSSQRLVDLCLAEGCDVYVTGHGALKYLRHEFFEEAGVEVRYMDYQKRPYPQIHGDFTPYVSVIDAIAHCGVSARDLVCSETVYWRDFHVR